LTSREGIADGPSAGLARPVDVSALNEDDTPVAYRIPNDPDVRNDRVRRRETFPMRRPACALLLTLLALPPAAEAASKSKMPALLENARYVALGYDLGDGFVSAANIPGVAARTLPDERRAIEAIHDDLEKGGRYVVTDRPEEAEILIVVRVGCRGGFGITSGGSAGDSRGEGGTRNGVVSSRTIGGQLSSNDDRVDVYEARHGLPGIRLWSGAEVGGMAVSPPRLYKSFREEVEAATKKP
jgi:hypothetical protein